MDCEICGKKDAVCLVYLEGAQMNACAGCARGGRILYHFSDESASLPLSAARRMPISKEEDVVDGYGKRIRDAREVAKLSVDALAKKIAERASYVEQVEQEKLLPSIELARKLEKALRITIVEMSTSGGIQPSADASPRIGRGGKKELTLADVAQIERKGRK